MSYFGPDDSKMEGIHRSSFSLLANEASRSTTVSRETLCKFAPDPHYCKSILPNQTGDVYTSGRYCFGKAFYQSRKFLSLVDKYLQRRSTLSKPVIRALEDCRVLAGNNMDFLYSSYQTVNKTSNTLSTMKADDVQSLLSAILTNQQTCLDGLKETSSSSSVNNGISASLSNDTKLYSVSLALFTEGWVPKQKKRATYQPTRKQLLFTNGRLPLKMSAQNQALYESVSRRKLSQTTDQVLVSDIVMVCQDGTGNFSTINDAVNAAPNNTDGTNGYFLIYIKAGVYEEYVSIAKNKKYLMIIGDGINQTVITGNRSVADGWTTFNSGHLCCGGTKLCCSEHNLPQHGRSSQAPGCGASQQFYSECDIYGTVDFIFGNAAVVLQNCGIYPRLPMSGQFNAITAQGRTDPNQNTGTSIHNCTIRAADDLASSNQTVNTYLGRPWKEYSRTVYMQSCMESLINPAGWQIWSGDFALSTLYYAEYNNTGPGSDTTNRVTWPGYHVINATNAANFTVSTFLVGDAWLPQTGVPYTGGLL
ncbi:hypothetical protein Patl1_00971 [Pistacia atlantica]|uniref:Uncharacterized protein n=1 Tax=Pistacia atlantica TaxID=434234 RepID=A0ACC1CAA5_9ROSI|nr:hypothetical protein Patl1_00971 [Pistacia atlantica]